MLTPETEVEIECAICEGTGMVECARYLKCTRCKGKRVEILTLENYILSLVSNSISLRIQR